MLRQANMVKRITASGGGTLEADAGTSLLIKEVYCIASTNDTYVTLMVDQTTVGYYRVKGLAGNHLSPIVGGNIAYHLMKYLNKHGVNVRIPVAEGQTFTVSRYAEAGNVIIVYDLYDAGDMTAAMPNGSAAREFTWVQYMTGATALTAAGDFLLDSQISPKQFPGFPCGKVVPSKHSIDLLALVASPHTIAAAGPKSFGTTFIKLIKDREVLLDEDRNGIPFYGHNAAATADAYIGTFSLVGPCVPALLDSATVGPGVPLLFDPAIQFAEGEELNAYITYAMEGAPTFDTADVDMAMVLRARKI